MINDGVVHAEGTPEQVITARNIEDVYGARGCVYSHPVNDLPAVLLTAGNRKSAKPREASEEAKAVRYEDSSQSQ
jgi:ABC-type cobalamin/Fe3+-siderophores transport system ATPase subunit